MKELQSSLFVNIMPIFTDRMASIEDRSGTIPVRDFCGIDISLNAKLLLIASYFCSVYPESEDARLFGRDDELRVKGKGRRRRKTNAAATAPGKPTLFSVHRLVALYQTMKLSWVRVSGVRSRLFPDSKSVTNYYGLVLSQLSLLTRLGLLTQVGVKGRAISLNQLLYRCNMK